MCCDEAGESLLQEWGPWRRREQLVGGPSWLLAGALQPKLLLRRQLYWTKPQPWCPIAVSLG